MLQAENICVDLVIPACGQISPLEFFFCIGTHVFCFMVQNQWLLTNVQNLADFRKSVFISFYFELEMFPCIHIPSATEVGWLRLRNRQLTPPRVVAYRVTEDRLADRKLGIRYGLSSRVIAAEGGARSEGGRPSAAGSRVPRRLASDALMTAAATSANSPVSSFSRRLRWPGRRKLRRQPLERSVLHPTATTPPHALPFIPRHINLPFMNQIKLILAK